ncbi:bifunctional helix-turn-helix transcriptional regulator/GNAT family N-acetyltransferase [Gaopeijia maritima]|uniref:bifunctional helix-turn-helix transcriptional regulator/GNAT family N-acetyltransferase n=1 Tax=Gaopeijia maritima TaxID=3119007 RepID=UPI00325399EB
MLPASPGALDSVDPALDDRIARVLAFFRAYDQRLGPPGPDPSADSHALSEARVIGDLAHRDDATVAGLARRLGLDPAQVGRIVRRLAELGDVARSPDPEDGRRRLLSLTGQGRHEFRTRQAATRRRVAALLEELPPTRQERLAASLDRAREVLVDEPDSEWALRGPLPGELGWIVQAHARIYTDEYGFDGRFEGLVAQIVADYSARNDVALERCWIAEHLGRPVGSVMAVRHTDDIAQLRCLIVDSAARGLGIGRRLVAECIDFARSVGYARMMLWTVDILPSARRIYEAAGFELTSETPDRLWGRDLVSQHWEREL